jgi:hypothetical protein
MSRFATELRELGPYAAIGLVLPGGTLLLISLWVLRHRRFFAAHASRVLAVLLALGAAVTLPGCASLAALQLSAGS